MNVTCPAAQPPLCVSLITMALEQPLARRRRKPCLPALDDLSRKWRPWRCRHCVLVEARVSANESRDLAPKRPVDERDPYLERVRHACPVRVTEQLIPHVP